MTMTDVINKTLLMYGLTAIISFFVAGIIQLLFMAVRKKSPVTHHGKDAHI